MCSSFLPCFSSCPCTPRLPGSPYSCLFFPCSKLSLGPPSYISSFLLQPPLFSSPFVYSLLLFPLAFLSFSHLHFQFFYLTFLPLCFTCIYWSSLLTLFLLLVCILHPLIHCFFVPLALLLHTPQPMLLIFGFSPFAPAPHCLSFCFSSMHCFNPFTTLSSSSKPLVNSLGVKEYDVYQFAANWHKRQNIVETKAKDKTKEKGVKK